jgi:hypothetical protein
MTGATVSGNVYVFTSPASQPTNYSPTGISKVNYWLDNPSMSGAARWTEGLTPYDFAGTASTNLANPWNTASIANGTHTITQLVTMTSGGTETDTATFTVNNGGATTSTVGVAISPTAAALQVGGTQQFNASVTGTTNTAVTWLVAGIQGGSTTTGSISPSGLYTAPASVPSGGTVTITARSAADGTKSASASVSISPAPTAVSISVSPTSASLQGGQTQQFSASVTGTTNTGVNWYVGGAQGGNSSVGTISSGGLYTAPMCPSQSTPTVTAQSAYDSSASASATLSLTAAASGTGGNYYVAANGSDSNDGSACRPWATIQHAASTVGAGATVHVGAGTYYITSAINSSKSGTSTAPITFVSTSRWGAKIVSNATIDSCWVNYGNYVNIEGFEITESSTGSCRIGILNRASYVRILSNKVHDLTKAWAITNCDGQNGAGGIQTYSIDSTQSNVDVIGNMVFHMGSPTNSWYTNHNCVYIHGFYIATPYTRVMNNMSFQNFSDGIKIGGGYSAAHVTAANNTVFANGYTGFFVGGTGSYVNMVNNIVYANNEGIDYQYAPAGGTFLNNLVNGNSSNWVANGSTSHSGDVNANPQFVNYQPDGSGDYHLAPGSPAINTGTSQGAPSNDFDGGPRPIGGAYDIGMYEMGTSTMKWPWW